MALYSGTAVASAAYGVWLISGNGWGFAVAWFPLLLFAIIQIFLANRLAQRIQKLLYVMVEQIGLITLDVLWQGESLTYSILSFGMVAFSTAIVGYTGLLFCGPTLFTGKPMRLADYLTNYIIPHAFVLIPGIIGIILAFKYLLANQLLNQASWPLLSAAILASAWTTLHALRRDR